ncbi:MAG TPA: hypothetical protein PLC42_00180, partial [Parachlamydiaceae bacterium]|nr:hypothetical protein [Parachlamydiaceae bacterium]
VQKELSHGSKSISNQKVEKLKDLLNRSELALKELKKVEIKQVVELIDIQNVIDNILKVKTSQGNFNPAVLQAILSSLQALNNNIGEIMLKESDHKRGQRVENVNYEKL